MGFASCPAGFCAGDVVTRAGEYWLWGCCWQSPGQLSVLACCSKSFGFLIFVQLAIANKTKRVAVKRLGQFILAHVKREWT